MWEGGASSSVWEHFWAAACLGPPPPPHFLFSVCVLLSEQLVFSAAEAPGWAVKAVRATEQSPSSPEAAQSPASRPTVLVFSASRATSLTGSPS